MSRPLVCVLLLLHSPPLRRALTDTQWTPPPSSPPQSPTFEGTSAMGTARPNTKYTTSPRNDFEKFLMGLREPVANFRPMTDEDLSAMYRSRGRTEDEIPQLIREYDRHMNARMKSWGGALKMIGAKPEDGNFQIFPIPGTRRAIRIWDAGMESFGQYMIDFFDLDNNIPINTPPGYEIHPAPPPGTVIPMAGPLVSLEKALGVPSEEILPGQEKFCVPEGSYWRLVRKETDDFLFAVPRRVVNSVPFAFPIAFVPGRT